MALFKRVALMVIFPGFNTLDFSGPVSVLYNAHFSICIAATDEHTTSQENVTVKRDLSLNEAKNHLEDYDVLVIPGSRPHNILSHVQPEGSKLLELLEVVTHFANLRAPSRSRFSERTIISVSIGVYLLAFAGVLENLTVTTHRLAVDGLRRICDDRTIKNPGSKGTNIVSGDQSEPFIYLDAGLNGSNVRIITTGATTCGIDGTLHYVGHCLGHSVATEVAALIGHHWRGI